MTNQAFIDEITDKLISALESNPYLGDVYVHPAFTFSYHVEGNEYVVTTEPLNEEPKEHRIDRGTDEAPVNIVDAIMEKVTAELKLPEEKQADVDR